MPVQRAGFPAPVMYAESAGRRKATTQLLWGDYVTVTGDPENGRLPVRAFGYEGWMDPADLQDERVLEIVFVDIGQGDGSLVVLPDDRKLLVDAGAGDNMHRFLRWRFGRATPSGRVFHRKVAFDTAVISHADLDHYGGFRPLFDEPNLSFDRVVHNGLVERVAAAKDDTLGPRAKVTGGRLVTDVVPDTAALGALLGPPANVGDKVYPRMLKAALDAGRVGDFRAVGVRGGPGGRVFLPGYEADKAISIEVLGPVVETVDGVTGLRWLGDLGKTKNGHSVVLRLKYREVSVLLGGDLNIPSENLLLSYHTGLPCPPATADAKDTLVFEARKAFRCEFAKACHHGSADFTDLFLRAVDPLATVISSGDDEPHAHPRADTLGTIGRCGRGSRPLIFSTELARSSSERVKNPVAFRAELLAAADRAIEAARGGDADALTRARDALQKKFLDIDRSVATYGAINLRTDGTRAVMAYKIERPSEPGRKWDVYRFEPGPDGRLAFASKHDD